MAFFAQNKTSDRSCKDYKTVFAAPSSKFTKHSYLEEKSFHWRRSSNEQVHLWLQLFSRLGLPYYSPDIQQISTCLHKQPLQTDKESRMHLLCLTLLFLIKWSAGLQCAINAQWTDKLSNSVSVQARTTPDLDIVNIANDATVTITCESFGPVKFQIHVKNSDSNPARTYYNGNKLAMSGAHFVPGRYRCECKMNGRTAVSAELFLAGTYACRHIPLHNTTLQVVVLQWLTHTLTSPTVHTHTYVRTHARNKALEAQHTCCNMHRLPWLHTSVHIHSWIFITSWMCSSNNWQTWNT